MLPAKSAPQTPSDPTCALPELISLSKFDHHIRHFDVLLRLIFDRHFEYDILLVIRNRFLADRLDQLAQSARYLAWLG